MTPALDFEYSFAVACASRAVLEPECPRQVFEEEGSDAAEGRR